MQEEVLVPVGIEMGDKSMYYQHQGRPLRIIFVFDPRRVGYLILGGDKTGDSSWYKTFIPKAEKIYAKHLAEILG